MKKKFGINWCEKTRKHIDASLTPVETRIQINQILIHLSTKLDDRPERVHVKHWEQVVIIVSIFMKYAVNELICVRAEEEMGFMELITVSNI